MVNVKMVCLSPDKENVNYIVEKAKIDLEETFDWLIKDMIRYQQSTEKTSLHAVSMGEGKLKKEASRDCKSAAECLFWSRGFPPKSGERL